MSVNDTVEYVGLAELLLFVVILFGFLARLCRVPVRVTVQSQRSQIFSTLLFLLLVAAILLCTFGSKFSTWTKFTPSLITKIVGEVIMFPSIVLMGWSQYHLGRQWTASIQLIENHKLVKTGPYIYLRHPFLISILLLNVGALLFAGSWLSFAMYLLNFMYSCYLVPLEESMLIEEFGMEYIEYRQNTGKFFPKMSHCCQTRKMKKRSENLSHPSREDTDDERFQLAKLSDSLERYGSMPI
eukprot:TRINITY_DN4122_c0_g2_i1.p1 TRINITY_DN4122_c0_g2~~TRINITY_DN4122_c0_g2_i1.p1  ORF type:complete len:241 (-),score=37.89 TRINITY_DN4122_c0_g2_i1:740-1462(-)